MSAYSLSENQKTMLFLIVPLLKKNTIAAEWKVIYQGDHIVAIQGLDGQLWRKGWRKARKSDLDDLVSCGLLRQGAASGEGTVVSYSLPKRNIIEAAENNFEFLAFQNESQIGVDMTLPRFSGHKQCPIN